MNDLQKIEELVTDVVRRLGFEASVAVHADEARPDGVHIRLSVSEGQHVLIGQHGLNLAALQHLLRLLCRKAAPDTPLLSVDINGYLEEKRGFLEREAREAAETALRTGFSVTLRPMPAFERRIIHTALADHPSVVTESAGTGEERKVLVRPKETLEAA